MCSGEESKRSRGSSVTTFDTNHYPCEESSASWSSAVTKFDTSHLSCEEDYFAPGYLASCAPPSPTDLPPEPAADAPSEATLAYGGAFAWVGAEYRLKVAGGLSLLQWLNRATNSLLNLSSLCFCEDGGFRRPDSEKPIFPVRGVDLRWRYDPVGARIIIDFFRRGEIQPWRWDELQISPDLRFPSTVPDLYGTGHVGKRTFIFSMLSAAAEDHASGRCRVQEED
jgi:hypothetical protein